MKWLNCEEIKVLLVVFMAVIILTGGIAKADFTFGEPVNLGPTVNSSSGDAPDCVSYDGLEMYLDRNSGGYGGWDIWVSKRETIDDDWGAPVNLGPTVNTSRSDACAVISVDGLELYFNSFNRSGGYGDWDAWVTRRPTKDEAWGAPVNLGPLVNSSAADGIAGISPDGLELYVSSDRSGGYGSDDIWVSRRATKNDPWGEPVNLGSVVNSSACEGVSFLSSDGLLLFFSEDTGSGDPIRPGGFGNLDMWVTRRSSLSDPWGTPVNLGPIVNTSSLDGGPRISPDGSILYFASERPGGYGGAWGDIYQAPIIPIVDLNGDANIDTNDLLILIDNWGTDETLCDIGPMPWGDGVVNEADLEVLMSYWGQEFDFQPFDLLAYWRLDESEGDIAYDSAGEYDGTLYGEPLWQPEGGIVNGALELDGINDYVLTSNFVLKLYGAFSAFAWIKGGAPGQVIISQENGVNWLMADPTDGTLRTDLRTPERSNPRGTTIPAGPPLISSTVVTDGDWHRVGFVWDGSHRILYVDDVEVATDVQGTLEGALGGVHIGAGKGLGAGSFFSGLIDDVRIYNIAVTP